MIQQRETNDKNVSLTFDIFKMSEKTDQIERLIYN